MKQLLLEHRRLGGVGLGVLRRNPKLSARETPDEEREQPGKQAEREHRSTAAPAGEDELRAHEHGEDPRD